jgi:hypothetical protein
MKIEKLVKLFQTILSKIEEELKDYATFFCASHGYIVNDFALRCDSTTLLPTVHAALTPALSYDPRELNELAVALEYDLNNIVFEYAYNMRLAIGTEDSNVIECKPFVSEHMQEFITVAQN